MLARITFGNDPAIGQGGNGEMIFNRENAAKCSFHHQDASKVIPRIDQLVCRKLSPLFNLRSALLMR